LFDHSFESVIHSTIALRLITASRVDLAIAISSGQKKLSFLSKSTIAALKIGNVQGQFRNTQPE
jgi:hypothetical protein